MTSLDLLVTGLRSGATSVRDLAALALRDEQVVRRELRELEEAGYVEVRGDTVRYAALPEAFSGDVATRTERLAATVTESLAELVDVVRRLPELAEAAGPGVGGEMTQFHGEDAVTDLWHHLVADQPLRQTDVVLPEAARIYVADPAMQATWHDVVGGQGNRARVIASIGDATHPDAQARLAEEVSAGVEIRLMDSPPSWFWVADGETVALPLAWGDAWPTSVVALRSRPVAGLAQWVFEQLWSQAVPATGVTPSWDPLLRLMSDGATAEAASRALGISARTGRRRIAEAMEHYGVSSLVGLGAAWASGR